MELFQVMKIIKKDDNIKYKPGVSAYFVNVVVDNVGGKIVM